MNAPSLDELLDRHPAQQNQDLLSARLRELLAEYEKVCDNWWREFLFMSQHNRELKFELALLRHRLSMRDRRASKEEV